MNAEAQIPPPPGRKFGMGVLVTAVVASLVLGGGGTYLLSNRDHDHGSSTPSGAEIAKEQWQCPMHPSIVQDHPGNCPICGMKLVKLAAAAVEPTAKQPSAPEPQKPQWQCPMHPSIVQDHPGNCPICGMKLVEMKPAASATQAPASGQPNPAGLATVTIDPERQQLIGLKVAHADLGEVGGSWRTTGKIAIDETRVHHVNVKFSGFMEQVYANFIGRPVKRGEPLFSIYSPELLSAQQELLLALDTRRRLGQAGGAVGDGDTLVEAARRKLELWDVPRTEIERIESTGKPSRAITFYSPATGVVTKKDVVPGMRVNAGDMPFEIVDLSRVWLLADAYESDLAKVKVGTAATLTLKAVPGRTFSGHVAFIDPLLDPKTRTAKVRIEFPNPTGELKPEMFGEAVLQGKGREGVRIPVDAVIHSGTIDIVFVALGDGKFQPREVKLGERSPELVEVVSGLEKGDGVITRANFLIDSESRLRASLASLSGAGPTAPAGEHAGHGGGDAPPAVEPQATPAANPHAGHGR